MRCPLLAVWEKFVAKLKNFIVRKKFNIISAVISEEAARNTLFSPAYKFIIENYSDSHVGQNGQWTCYGFCFKIISNFNEEKLFIIQEVS